MTSDKRRVTECLEKSVLDGYGIDDAVRWLQEKRTHYTKQGYTNLRLGLETYSYRYDPNDYTTMCLTGERSETDAELQARVTADKDYRERRRQEYERLKQEFE